MLVHLRGFYIRQSEYLAIFYKNKKNYFFEIYSISLSLPEAPTPNSTAVIDRGNSHHEPKSGGSELLQRF